MLGFAMDGMTCFMVALVTLLLSCPGPPWCVARRLVLPTGLPVLLPLLLSLPASLASPVAGKGMWGGWLQPWEDATWRLGATLRLILLGPWRPR